MTGWRFFKLLPVLVLPMLMLGACGGPDQVGPPETPTSTTEPSVVVDVVPDNGWIQVGGLTFDLAFTCFAPGAGDVVAVGVGEHPMLGQEVTALVQGFLGRPYVGVMVGGQVMFEAALDDPLEVYLHDDKITAGAVRWQEGLDLESGQGEPAGFGAVFVDCPGYESGLPDGY
ncbi:MAG: hypothetical protein NZ600_01360 [Acidimicrobiales bacterium]|nr:hypothetical protein [Acidimicrobiales bacterium]